MYTTALYRVVCKPVQHADWIQAYSCPTYRLLSSNARYCTPGTPAHASILFSSWVFVVMEGATMKLAWLLLLYL